MCGVRVPRRRRTPPIPIQHAEWRHGKQPHAAVCMYSLPKCWSRRLAGALLFGGSLLTYFGGAARSDDFTVYPPYVIASQNEIELRSFRYADSRTDLGGSGTEMSIAHGVNDWWKPEVYLLKYAEAPGAARQLQGYEFENTFQLTPQGKYWADVGFLASYEHNTLANSQDAVEFGPLLGKTVGRFAHVVNLIWEKPVGAGADRHYEFRYSYTGTYAVSQGFRPGVEAYCRPADHAYQAGPVVAGEWRVPGTRGNLEYRFGVVFGINVDAPQQTWLARLEYEFL